MSTSIELPVPGQIARVRQRLYLVEDTIDAKNPADSTLVRFSCVDDDAQGQSLEVLWEREIDPEILTGEAWEEIARRGFDEPQLFAAYMDTLLQRLLEWLAAMNCSVVLPSATLPRTKRHSLLKASGGSGAAQSGLTRGLLGLPGACAWHSVGPSGRRKGKL